MQGLKKRWELNGRLIENGDKLYIEYEPYEHLNPKEVFIYVNGKLIKENGEAFELEDFKIYIDSIEFLNK